MKIFSAENTYVRKYAEVSLLDSGVWIFCEPYIINDSIFCVPYFMDVLIFCEPHSIQTPFCHTLCLVMTLFIISDDVIIDMKKK